MKLKDSFYVDNCLASIDSVAYLEYFKRESQKILKADKFDLCGWRKCFYFSVKPWICPGPKRSEKKQVRKVEKSHTNSAICFRTLKSSKLEYKVCEPVITRHTELSSELVVQSSEITTCDESRNEQQQLIDSPEEVVYGRRDGLTDSPEEIVYGRGDNESRNEQQQLIDSPEEIVYRQRDDESRNEQQQLIDSPEEIVYGRRDDESHNEQQQLIDSPEEIVYGRRDDESHNEQQQLTDSPEEIVYGRKDDESRNEQQLINSFEEIVYGRRDNVSCNEQQKLINSSGEIIYRRRDDESRNEQQQVIDSSGEIIYGRRYGESRNEQQQVIDSSENIQYGRRDQSAESSGASNSLIVKAVDDNECVATVSSSSGDLIVRNKISVLHTKNTKFSRKWDKKYYCPYCEIPFGKLVRHMEKVHADESEVQFILAAKNNTSISKRKRERMICKLRNIGNHKHNINVLERGGELIVVYRPSINVNVDPCNYVPCPTCYGYYGKKELWKHKCFFKGERKRRERVIQAGRNLLPFPSHVEQNVREIFLSMRQDTIYAIAKYDRVICEYLRRMFYAKGGHEIHRKAQIRNNIREIARLLQEARRVISNESCTLQDLIDPSEYSNIITAVKNVTGYNENDQKFLRPELARKLGLHLKTSASIVQGFALTDNNRQLLERSENFLKLHNTKFYSEIGAQVLRNRNESKLNMQKSSPAW
ncbi:uncharacterized protein LOC118195486 [Stegodyphus dumicola]|uniref:uncharacterized protein LOC118195486 n=1 Tax=Stegodyphus dumicola TaxID=202533 RepID=UPI0015AA59BE|nr:uncharacterized protein LOC118195486 [Stegodyphus dumicola]